MSQLSTTISGLAANLLHWSPSTWLHSWLLYLGIQTHVRHTIDPELRPLHNVCEYLNALHVYAEEARRGEVRTVEAFHFCSHISKDLRQCLIYDSNSPSAKLIGVEYMVPKHIYDTLDPGEQALWHSHEFEVKSGMLVLPKPPGHGESEWEKLETEAMKEVVGLYGKTWHFWQVDRGDPLPLGRPVLMGSLNGAEQVDLDQMLKGRDERFGVDYRRKADVRKDIQPPGLHERSDDWWSEAKREKSGIYS